MAEHKELIDRFNAFFARNLEGGVDNRYFYGPELGQSPPVAKVILNKVEDAVLAAVESEENSLDRDQVVMALTGMARSWKHLCDYWGSTWSASEDRTSTSPGDQRALRAAFDVAVALGMPIEDMVEEALAEYSAEWDEEED